MKECNSIYILQYEVYPLGHLPTLWSKMCSPQSHHTFQVYINRSNQSINTININIMSDYTLYKIFCQFEQPLHFSALRVAVALQSGHHASYNWACLFIITSSMPSSWSWLHHFSPSWHHHINILFLWKRAGSVSVKWQLAELRVDHTWL